MHFKERNGMKPNFLQLEKIGARNCNDRTTWQSMNKFEIPHKLISIGVHTLLNLIFSHAHCQWVPANANISPHHNSKLSLCLILKHFDHLGVFIFSSLFKMFFYGILWGIPLPSFDPFWVECYGTYSFQSLLFSLKSEKIEYLLLKCS